MKMKINTDGGYNKHLGAACSYIITCDDNVVHTCSFAASGYSTNNQAEYGAVLSALKHVSSNYNIDSIESIEHIADSQLLVNHFNGTNEIKEPTLVDMMREIKTFSTLVLKNKVTSTHVRRHLNTDADWLCNLVLDAF